MNDSVKKMLEYNRVFVDHEMYQRYATTKYPDRKIAILSCMDTRMTELLPAALGIKNGDVKLIKNDCGGRALDAKKMIAKMEEKGISRDVIDHVDANHKNLEQWLTGFGDICTSVQNTVDTIRNHPLIHKDVEVYGFVMDPHTGAMREVTCADK